MKILIAAVIALAAVGCEDPEMVAKLKASTAKDFADNWTMATVEYDGHKFIVGTYGTVRKYDGAMVHHPDCRCTKK